MISLTIMYRGISRIFGFFCKKVFKNIFSPKITILGTLWLRPLLLVMCAFFICTCLLPAAAANFFPEYCDRYPMLAAGWQSPSVTTHLWWWNIGTLTLPLIQQRHDPQLLSWPTEDEEMSEATHSLCVHFSVWVNYRFYCKLLNHHTQLRTWLFSKVCGESYYCMDLGTLMALIKG